ncbi:GntR family transcriptional regulator [Streptomyces niveus]|uniref:GntR family transcriptional regulator n=1 Tax=Streptomyces niveus TaxID=193462 RepID=A0ABZ2AAB0_STRNV|nr:GntR family transcriptional regulator [Streptomyces niveus]WTA58739.1 GntR family transcriptional regulator [Streptomyces niveus]
MPPQSRRTKTATTDGVVPGRVAKSVPKTPARTSAKTAAKSTAKGPTKRDRIATELRRMISEGELPRGSRIQQDVLAAMFDTSITPVREALRLLEAEGVLVGEPHKGVRVADADYEQVKTVYLLRMLVEPYAMQRAARRLSPLDIDLAERLVTDMEQAAEEGDRARLNASNYQFHFLFYAKCGNDGLAAEIDQLWQKFPWDVLQVLHDRADETSNEHRSMLAAARLGDGDALAKATQWHLSRSFLALGKHLTGRPVADPFDVDND